SLKDVIPFRNKSTKTWNLHYDDCTIQIFETKKKITFWIKEQVGICYDEIQSRMLDVFIRYVKVLESYGFALARTFSSRNPHFADPDGFFARLATEYKVGAFKIETEVGDFWIDYSKGVAEEETSSEDVAN